MIRAAALFLCLVASPALAEEFPALADVTGVAADDVLNIRERPSADAPVVGALPPDATGVEVIAMSGTWAQVNTAEQTGYVAARYLLRDPSPAWNALETPLDCFGTEPFWSLAIDPSARTATMVSTDDLNGTATTIVEIWPGMPWAPVAALSTPEGTIVLSPAACSDGMSDRSYGIAIDLFLTGPAGGRLSGCCSLAVR